MNQRDRVSIMRIDFRPEEGATRHRLAEGIALQLPANAFFHDVELEGGPHRIAMRLEMTSEGVRPTQVTVDGNARPVTGTTLREVRVWDLAERAIRLGLSRSGGAPTQLGDEQAAELRASGPKPETLDWVAFFYNLGSAIGLPAARQVEIGLGVPRTTASKWVRRAREAGLIDQAAHEEQGVQDAKFLSVAEVATMLNVSAMTVHRLVHGGELPAVSVGRSYRVNEHDVRAYEEQRRQVAG
jgi:excisionase family DNA binding protein